MPRFSQSFRTEFPVAQAYNIFNEYAMKNGFKYFSDENGDYWKRNSGFLKKSQFIRLYNQNELFTLEAWTRFAILPKVYLGEKEPKSSLKKLANNALIALYANPVNP